MTAAHPHAHSAGRRRASVAAGLAAGLSLLLAACGVGLNASPNVVAKKDVPYGLLRPSPPTSVSSTPGQYATIYLDGPGRLVAVARDLTPPVTIARVLRALADGPTSAEAAEGFKSPLSTAAPLSVVHSTSTTVVVGIATSFTSLAEQDQAVAVAQLVFTLTVFPGIESVEIRIDGKRAKVPTASGTLSAGPLTRADYATLGPI